MVQEGFLNATGGRWGLKGSFHFILTMISTLSWTIDNVENDSGPISDSVECRSVSAPLSGCCPPETPIKSSEVAPSRSRADAV